MTKLLIAIPALDEEASIAAIIERCLAAAPAIVAASPVDAVEVTVVSDGSTDRTVEIASRYADRIGLVVFPRNRGYGAAIQEAWRRSDAELLGFLDADGTCDPAFFATLCRTLEARGADVALGSRMHRGSRMPPLRRLGNRLFAWLLSAFSSAPVRDTASGMRVVRRRVLPRLLPLPDGLHFTPAMSARALLAGDVVIVEEEMPYEERQGESKLRVLADGMRFLRIIVDTALLYRPSRPLGLLALALLLLAVALMVPPTAYYLRHRSLLEWMIYRFIVAHLLGVASCQLFCAAYLAGRVVEIALGGAPHATSLAHRLLRPFFTWRFFWAVPGLLLAVGVALVWSSFVELVQTGATLEHWSRFVAMSFCWLIAFVLAGARIVDHVLGLIGARLRYLADPAEGGSAAAAPGGAGPGRR
jgi:glycosyltransferase involved in cell wall biosynthesis